MRIALEPYFPYGQAGAKYKRRTSYSATLASAITAVLLLTACGGGGGSGTGSDGGGTEPPPPPPPPGNEQPVAVAGCSTTPQSDPVRGRLQAIDSDNSQNELTFSLDAAVPNVAGPVSTAKGTVQLLNTTTGEFTYTPNEVGARGVDTFTFRVDDPESFTTGTETVIINPAIMPLGDSITEGVLGNSMPSPDERIGYRGPLLSMLNAASFEVDLVGSLQSGQAAAEPIDDADHEGYGGAKADQLIFGGVRDSDGELIPGIFNALEQNPTDIVLLHIGTNDIPTTDPPDTIASDIRGILDEIDRWEASTGGNPVTVLLAKIIERTAPDGETCSGCNAKIAALNAIIDNIAAERAGDDLLIVNQHDALTYPEDMFPQTGSRGGITYIHPDTIGYSKMAAAWLPALVASGKLATCE
jgi:lysophospholipase L1-like esterase